MLVLSTFRLILCLKSPKEPFASKLNLMGPFIKSTASKKELRSVLVNGSAFALSTKG